MANLHGGFPVPAPNVTAHLDSTRAKLEQHHGGAAAHVKLEDAGGADMLKRRRIMEREDVDDNEYQPTRQRVSLERRVGERQSNLMSSSKYHLMTYKVKSERSPPTRKRVAIHVAFATK